MVELGCQDTDWVGGNDRGFRCDFTPGGSHTSHFGHGQRKSQKTRAETIFRFSETLATSLGWKRFHKTELTLRVNA